MFAAAKSDFEPDAVEWTIEQFGEITGAIEARPGDVERKPWQQMFDQVGLVQAELMALAAAEK